MWCGELQLPFSILNIQFLLPQFLIVLFRIGGMTVSAPMVSSAAVPARIRVALSFVISLMVFPIVLPKIPSSMALDTVLVAVFSELMIGLTMGLAVGLVFLGINLTGMIIGQQAGLALASVINPMQDTQSTIIGQIYFMVTLMIYLAIGGHRVLLRALLETFETIPPGSFHFDQSMLLLIGDMLTSAFQLAIRLAAPALAALFIASLTMGFLSRTIPQLNILTVGFPVRIVVGLSAAGLSLSLAYDLLYDSIIDAIDTVRAAFELSM